MFGLLVSCVPRPCLYMLGSSSLTRLFRTCNWLTSVVCGRRVYHTRSSRGASKRRTFLTVHTKEEHIIILILKKRDHLIMLPSRSYLSNIKCIKVLTSHA